MEVKIHDALIAYIREHVDDKFPLDISNNILIRMMFLNVRGRDNSTYGIRLTNFGLQVMKTYFLCYEIPLTETPITSIDLLYLDCKARLPYHLIENREHVLGDKRSAGLITCFDLDLGTKLMLAGGDIAILIKMDGFETSSF